jgi:hypothetical protein
LRYAPVVARFTWAFRYNGGKTAPKATILPGNQVPVSETPDAKSSLFLEGLPVARKCTAILGTLRARDRGMSLAQVVTPDIEDPDALLF